MPPFPSILVLGPRPNELLECARCDIDEARGFHKLLCLTGDSEGFAKLIASLEDERSHISIDVPLIELSSDCGATEISVCSNQPPGFRWL